MEYDLVNKIHWTPQLVKKFWDGVAQTELDNLSFGKVAGPQFLELISNYLAPSGSHLDFGAGSGDVLQLLLDRGLNSAGFEPSPERQALLLAKIGGHKNFLGVKGLASNEQFDVVLLMEVVEHVLDEDFDAVLGQVAAFVKPGGYLIASTPNNEDLESSNVYCPVSDTLFHRWQHVRSFTPESLSGCFASRGFAAEFIALADFSQDATIIEGYKAAVAAADQLSVKRYQLQLESLYQIGAFFGGHSSTLGFWSNIKRRIKSLLHHQEIGLKLHSISHELAAFYDEISSQIKLIKAPKLFDVAPSSTICSGVDLRFGKETTIVYVGKKQ